MDSFTTELVSIASSQLLPNNTLSSCTNFIPEQVNLEGPWEVALSEVYPSMYQNVTEAKIMFFDEILSKLTQSYYSELGLCSSVTDIVETMRSLIQERNNHSDTCIRNKGNRATQKNEVHLANEESSLAVCSTDLRHIF